MDKFSNVRNCQGKSKKSGRQKEQNLSFALFKTMNKNQEMITSLSGQPLVTSILSNFFGKQKIMIDEKIPEENS
jgi:hypothetical protein